MNDHLASVPFNKLERSLKGASFFALRVGKFKPAVYVAETAEQQANVRLGEQVVIAVDHVWLLDDYDVRLHRAGEVNDENEREDTREERQYLHARAFVVDCLHLENVGEYFVQRVVSDHFTWVNFVPRVNVHLSDQPESNTRQGHREPYSGCKGIGKDIHDIRVVSLIRYDVT